MTVAFDESKTSVEKIMKALADSGHPAEGEPKWISGGPSTSKVPENMLVGRITREELYKAFPVLRNNADSYTPQSDYVRKIRNLTKKTDVVMFLGTWCKDTISEAPKLLKVYESAGNPFLSLTLFGVDREKRDGLGMAEKLAIQRVPTVIFFGDGRELGRIVEVPKKPMEEDVWEIINR